MMRDYLLMATDDAGFASILIPDDEGATLPPQALSVLAYTSLGRLPTRPATCSTPARRRAQPPAHG